MEFPERIYISPDSFRLKGTSGYISLIKVENETGIYEGGHKMDGEFISIKIGEGASILAPWYESEEAYQEEKEKHRLYRVLMAKLREMPLYDITAPDIKKAMKILKIKY